MTATNQSDIMADVNRLESLPNVVLKALELINDPRSTPQQLAAALSLDQGLTTRVLALASSAFFGVGRRSLSLRESLVRVGFNAVRSLVITAAVAPALDRPLPGYVLDRGQLWRHSVACGLCARNVAAMVGYRDREEAYIAGLLHDIGKLIIDRHLRGEFAQVFAMAEQQRIPFIEAERMIIGFDHAQIGEIVLEKWQLPAGLSEAVGKHHAPLQSSGTSLLPAIIHVADAITLMLGIGVGGDGLYYAADYEVVRQLGLDVPRIETLMAQLTEAMSQAEDFLRLAE
jgi:putative nucleotidyltransferase with HDIG domain